MAEVASEGDVPGTMTDDSCIAGYIEIVPLDRSRVDFSEISCCDEVKQEFPENIFDGELLVDIKQEPFQVQEVYDTKDIYDATEVRLCLCI